jgi:hypothetical protein
MPYARTCVQSAALLQVSAARTRRLKRKMTHPGHGFVEGNRVRAVRRPQFPDGTIMKLLNDGYLLVLWDGDVIETAHYSELVKAATPD